MSGLEEAGGKPFARRLSLDFAGVPIKKRRFIRPPSPPPEEGSSKQVQKDTQQKEHSGLSETAGNSSAGKDASTLLASDATGSFAPKKKEGRCADPNGPTGYFTAKVEPSAVGCAALSAVDKEAKLLVSEKSLGVASSTLLASEATGSLLMKQMEVVCAGPAGPSGHTVKVEPSAAGRAVLSATSDKEAKLLVSEKSVGVASSILNDGLDSRPSDFVKERSDKQRDEGSISIMCKTLGNPDLSLGSEGQCISSLGGNESYKNSGVFGNIETVSLNLSLSSKETCPDIAANRSNWDLNTTMDAWEDSGSDAAIQSKPIPESQNVKPPICLAGIQETCFNSISNQLLRESDCRSRTGDAISQTVERPIPEASLNLRLSPSIFSMNIGQEPSSSSINKQLPGSVSNISLPSFLAHINANKVGTGIVKPEPVDEGLRLDSGGTISRALHSLKSTAVKVELIGRPGPDVLSLLHYSPTVNSIAPGSIKSELFHEPSLRMSETAEASLIQCDISVLNIRDQSTCSPNELECPDTSALNVCQTMDKQVLECHEMTGKSACFPVLSETGVIPEDFRDDYASGSRHSMELAKAAGSVDVISSAKNSPCRGQVGHESIVHGRTDTANVEEENTNSSDTSNRNFVDKLAAADDQVHPVGDKDKICSSQVVVEEECAEVEYESDGNSVPMDIEDDGQRCDGTEDGVLPEPGKDVAVDSINEVLVNYSVDGASHDAGTSGELQGEHLHTELHSKAMENPSENPATIYADVFKSAALEEERSEESRGDVSVEEPLAVQMPPGEADEGASVITSQQELPIMSGEALNGLGTDQLSNQAHSGGQESSVTVVQDSDENVKLNDVDQNYLQLPKGEESLGDDSAKDPSTGVHRSRIINLSRASTETTPSKARPMGSCTLTSYAARERLPDGPLEGDRQHPRDRSDFCYNDGFRRFSRERHQDRRNYRMNYARGRGRLSDGNDSVRGARTSGSNFVPELSDCLSEYGVPKNKYVAAAVAAAVAATGADTKYVNHNVADDVFVGAGRERRKVGDDEAENFHRLSSRRRSPVGRDAARGIQMTRRVSRNINEDGAEGVGLRRAARFMRGIPADGGERSYSRNQRPFEGVDSHFGQGTRNILSIQRRTLPRFHSKSPIRSRSPPGQWPSSKKRSPDAFDGPSDLTHRGSSPIYRMDRMRSPDHAGFPTEVATRRHGSPTFLSRANELRGLDSSREHAHSRSMISRSPTSRVALRNNRRFGAGNPRDRTDGDEFVTGPTHSGRFQEVNDGDIEDRRRFGERRGPVRSFRPTFNVPDEDNYPVSTEDRTLRFFRSDDQQFQERVNLRERPFERGMKNRSVNAPRRQRGVEDEEGNYTGQGMYDDDQDDMSRLKRKRF